MHIGLFQIIFLFSISISGFYCAGKEVSHNNFTYDSKNLRFTSKSLNKSRDCPYNYELILARSSNPIINVLQHRNIHFSQGVNNRPNTYTISVNYLNFICGQGNSELSHFRRLILFPFHDFW